MSASQTIPNTRKQSSTSAVLPTPKGQESKRNTTQVKFSLTGKESGETKIYHGTDQFRSPRILSAYSFDMPIALQFL